MSSQRSRRPLKERRRRIDRGGWGKAPSCWGASPKWLLGPLVLVFAACHGEEAKPQRPARDSFGSEVFGVLCDRVGAQALHEDLSGASYNGICHEEATKVDVARLGPPVDPKVRELGIAKIEALGRHRTALIAALDVVFPDDTVVGKDLSNPDPKASCDPKTGQPRKEQLRGLLTRLLPAKGGAETVPESSRALARSINPLMNPDTELARQALSHAGARRGYLPPDFGAGVLGAMFTAPRLRDTLGAATHLFSTDAAPFDKPGTVGTGHDALVKFIGAAKEELLSPVKDEPLLRIGFDPDSNRSYLSRPRTTLELAREVLLSEDPAFSNGQPLYLVRRDPRGVAAVSRGPDGKVPALFLDKNGDNLPDLDRLGRFVIAPGQKAPADPFIGEERSAAYQYIDARATAASAMLRHLAPLSDPDGGAESLFNAAEGLEPLLRDGKDALLDLAYAAAQASADTGTDEALALIGRLFKEQPQLMARITGNLLDAKAVLDAHPEATIPDGSTVVDDVLTVVVKMSRVPGLLEEVLGSMGDDRALFLREAFPALLTMRDRLTYDRNALNGLPINITKSGTPDKPEGGPPANPVDWSQPSSGGNRSIFHRFLQLIHDTRGVALCNKDQAVVHVWIPNGDPAGPPEVDFPYPTAFGLPPPPECGILKIPDLGRFYLQATIGAAPLRFRDDILNGQATAATLRASTGIDGYWPTPAGAECTNLTSAGCVRPMPTFLNRLVFFDVLRDSPNPTDRNYRTNLNIRELQGPHVPTNACVERVIDDPMAGVEGMPDVDPDKKIHGLRTCQEGQWLDQRDPDTLFALEYNHGYDAIAPLTSVFVKHHQEDLMLELLDVLYKHWEVPNGVAQAQPAVAQIIAGDLVPSMGALTKVLQPMSVKRCAATSYASCEGAQNVPAVLVLTDGLRAMLDPANAQKAGLVDRRGKNTTVAGRPLTIFGLFRDALNAEDAVLNRNPGLRDKWLAARSHIVDEFAAVNGRGPEAKFADPGIPQIVPVIIDLLRSQRLAKCQGTVECPLLRQQLARDIEETLDSNLTKAGLDLFDVVLKDAPTRRELGRLFSYMTRQENALGGVSASPSSTPFATTKARAPGALDQTIAALVDALGAIGDMRDIRPLYPVLAQALDHLDPQLALLSRLNARAFDSAGVEICSKELDPEETIRNSLSRLALTVKPEGQPKRSVLQIFLEALAEVNRIDASNTGVLDEADYGNVFKNVHELLTDPTSGLEQLYASVKKATEK